VEIKVSGVMAGSRGAVAILSLNDGSPRSFFAGGAGESWGEVGGGGGRWGGD